MSLSPEERRQIYEEEKLKLEAEQTQRKEQESSARVSATGLKQNVAGLLCYLGGWITGIIFLVIEQKNQFVRFHAAQSIVVFGILNILQLLMGQIPYAGYYFNLMFGITAFVLWIILMVKAYHNEWYRLPVAADLAERLSGLFVNSQNEENRNTTSVVQSSGVSEANALTENGEKVKKVSKKEVGYYKTSWTERVVGSCFAIFWSFAFLIFLNFYNQYIAVYNLDPISNKWISYPLLTSDFTLWLPIITTALVLAIAGNIIIIIMNKYIVYEATHIILNFIFISAFSALLTIFPFNFSNILDPVAISATAIIVRVIIGIVLLTLGIATLVRIIRFIVNLASGNI